MMKDLGYAKGYRYDHDEEEGFSGQNYFPESLPRRTFYRPKGEGAEAAIKARLAEWEKLRSTKKPS